jgi:hypothetical protein
LQRKHSACNLNTQSLVQNGASARIGAKKRPFGEAYGLAGDAEAPDGWEKVKQPTSISRLGV